MGAGYHHGSPVLATVAKPPRGGFSFDREAGSRSGSTTCHQPSKNCDSNEHVRPTAATVPDRPRNANHSHGRFRTGSNGKSNRQRFQKYRAEPGTSFRTKLEEAHPNPSRCQWVPDSDGSGEPARTAPGTD